MSLSPFHVIARMLIVELPPESGLGLRAGVGVINLIGDASLLQWHAA